MTASALSPYFDWLDAKLKTVEYGTISVSFTICDGAITRIDKQVNETEKYSLDKNKG